MFLHWAQEDTEARFLVQRVLDTKFRLGTHDDVADYAKKLLAIIDGTGNSD
jgi:hypothetical protein